MTSETERLALAHALWDIIRGLVRRFSISERADVSCCGMTVAQSATLDVLLSEGSMRLGALGRRLGISPSTLTRNLERLEHRSLLERVADPDDARATRVRLTTAGQEAAGEVERQQVTFVAAVLDRLPPSRRRPAVDNLSELLHVIREATESCCPGAFEHLLKGVGGEQET